ncbi:ATP-dependent helicase [bacterium]|nr:ATP-dependent helicase [bacterium]
MREDILKNLNKEQKEAVLHKNGPLLIVAGAGTGKTTVITKRIANIIKNEWASPEEILALTFTEKAASEMEERVIDNLTFGYFDLWISTFHSFAERILREEGLSIGLPTDFRLLNEFDQYILFKKNLDKFNLDYYKPLGNPTKFIKTLLGHFSRAKDEDISPNQYLEYANGLEQNLDGMLSGSKFNKKSISIVSFQNESGGFDEEIASQEVLRIKEIANAYHTYNQLLLEDSCLDFGDLINYCLKLFRERPIILKKYHEKFKYILLDEFQDTNWAQYELIKLLAEPKNNFIVCLDDDQSIYKFRGASTSNVQQFIKDYPRAKQVFLINNYRNGQEILDLSYKFISQNNPNRLEYQINQKNGKNKLSKKLISKIKERGEIKMISEDSVSEEMNKMVKKIVELKEKDKKISWDDFAILVRTNQGVEDVCEYLNEAELPYILYSSKGLYNKELIMNIISYFKSISNYHNDVSFFKILNLPVFKFSTKELANFNHLARRKTLSLLEVLNNSSGLGFKVETQKKIQKVLPLIKKHSSEARDKSASEMFLNILNDTGLLQYLIEKGDYRQDCAILLNQFLKRIKSFESNSSDKSVSAFLEELQMEIDAGETGNIPIDLDVGPETIKVMTVHAAKGLEFKCVFITHLVDKRFPTIERREALPLPDDLIKEVLPEGDIHIEEERRLFYVALTRAKEKIFLSWSADHGGKILKKPSQFLVETGFVSDPNGHLKKKVDKNKTDLLDLERKEKKAQFVKNSDKLPIPTTFSYTQIMTFINCPYQYRFAHILKVPSKGKSVFSFGKTLHGVLEKMFKIINNRREMNQGNLFENKNCNNKELITLEEIFNLYEESWINDWYESKKSKEEYFKKGKKILKDFYNKYKDSWPEVILLEKGFNFKINVDGEHCAIRGAMDRVDQDGDEIKIIDYKTGQMPKDGKLVFNKKLQLLIYQIATRDLFRQKVKSLSFYYLENNKEIEFLGGEKDIKKAEEKIIKTIQDIKKGDFSPKSGPLCKYCDFKDICEYKKI